MTKSDLPIVTSRKDAKNSENTFSPSTLYSIRELAEMTAYGIFFGAMYGGTRGYLNMRNVKIPTSTLDRMRTNLFYRKQMKDQQNQKENPSNEFNPNKSKQEETINTEYDPQSTRVDRKHIILAHLFHQAFRFATNVGLFAFSFSSIDLLLRSKNVFNCYHSDDDEEKDENSLKYQIQSISEKFAKVTLTEDQLKTIEENNLLNERVKQLNILHKPIAGTVSGGVFGLLASVPNLFMGIGSVSGALSLTVASIGYGLIFGTLSGMCLIPLQSFYMVERFKTYQEQNESKKEDEIELALQQEEDGIESELLKDISKKSKVSLQAFINEEETFLNQLEKVSDKIKDIKLSDEEIIESTQENQKK